METDHIDLFVDVVRLGSFAAAARHRAIDPSSVSRAIASLEGSLGCRLFQRSTRRLSLTEAGATFFERAESLSEGVLRARDEIRTLSRGPTGLLRVTASVAFGVTRLAGWLPSFRARFPDLAVDVTLSDRPLDLIADRIDVALRHGPALDVGYTGRRLMSTRFRVVASPDYLRRRSLPDGPGDLTTHDCVVLSVPGFTGRWLFRPTGSEDASRRIEISGGVSLSNPLAVRECVRQGLGPALLSDWLIDNDLATGDLVDLLPDWDVTATEFDTAIWILYPSRDYLPAKVRVFINHLETVRH